MRNTAYGAMALAAAVTLIGCQQPPAVQTPSAPVLLLDSVREPIGPWDLLWVEHTDKDDQLTGIERTEGEQLPLVEVYRIGRFAGYRLAQGEWTEGPYRIVGAAEVAHLSERRVEGVEFRAPDPVFHVEQWANGVVPQRAQAYALADPHVLFPIRLSASTFLDGLDFELQLDPIDAESAALSFIAVNDAGQACVAYQDVADLDALARIRVEREVLESPQAGERPGLIYDLGLYFGTEGELAGGLVADGLVDLTPWVSMVESADDVGDLCDLVAAFGVSCEVCPDNDLACLQLVVEAPVLLPTEPHDLEELAWCVPPDQPLVPDIELDFDCGCSTGAAGWAWLGLGPLVGLRRKRKES